MRHTAFALLVACHTPSATHDPAPTASTTPAPIPTPTPTPSEIGTAPLPAVVEAGAPSPNTIDDVAAWLRARNVKVPPALANDPSCTEEKLGTNVALLCRSAPESLPTGESVYPLSVWIISSGAATLALSAAAGAGPLDREFTPGEPAPDDMYVEFDVTITGSTLTIADRAHKPCAQVLAGYTSREWDGHRRVVQKACATRGRYELQNGKLVRAP
jgi:hypothetical protein